MVDMITIDYSNTGIPYSDFAIDWFVGKVIEHKNEDRLFEISTGLCVDAIRLAVKQGKLDYREIQFSYNNNIILVDKNGSLDNWPSGFHDKFDSILNGILDL